MTTMRKIIDDMRSPKSGLEYANRFTTNVGLLMVLFDIGILVYNTIDNMVLSDNTFNSVREAIYNDKNQQYIVTLILLFVGGVFWSINSELDTRIHTAIIIGLLLCTLQILFICIGDDALALNYIVIMLTIIYARPLFTVFVGIIIYIYSIVSYYSVSLSAGSDQLTDALHMRMYNQEERYSVESILFFQTLSLIIAVLVSLCIKKIYAYNKEYAYRESVAIASNQAAEQIQQQILESSHIDETAKENVSVYPFLKVANYVAGDFFDYYSIDRYRVCFMIADVSGKGIAAGLFMVRAKEVLKVSAKDHMNPAKVIERANNELCENNNECMFATVWLGILNLRTGELKYTNAGHTAPIFVSNNRAIMLNEVSGPMLGSFPNMTYRSHIVNMMESDRILLYTDGVTDQPIGDNVRYDEKGLMEYVSNNTDTDNLCEGIYNDIVSRCNESKATPQGTVQDESDETIKMCISDQFDDITMLQLNLDKLKKKTSVIGKTIDKHLYLAAVPKSVRTVRKLINSELEGTNVSKTDITTFYVALEEMITNIIKYAYGSEDNNGGFSLDFRAEDDHFNIMLKDSGVEFNPFLYDNSVYANKDGEITEGGRGIKIFTDMMDEYTYERIDGVNVVRARKYITERKKGHGNNL